MSMERPDFAALFAEQVTLPDNEVDLPRAALYIAGLSHPDLDVDHYMGLLNNMALEVQDSLAGTASSGEVARALNDYLFVQNGYAGNAQDYYNPQNSFLNCVMDTRRGIPITLSVLYLGLAHRLGLDCHGVGMPGHFLVSVKDLDLFMDPFHHGHLLSAADCHRLIEALYGGKVQWDEDYLAPTPPRMILARMLNNLRLVYSQAQDWGSQVPVLEQMLVIDGKNIVLLRDLALAQIRLGDNPAAIATLERLIQNSTRDRETAAARSLIAQLRGEE